MRVYASAGDDERDTAGGMYSEARSPDNHATDAVVGAGGMFARLVCRRQQCPAAPVGMMFWDHAACQGTLAPGSYICPSTPSNIDTDDGVLGRLALMASLSRDSVAVLPRSPSSFELSLSLAFALPSLLVGLRLAFALALAALARTLAPSPLPSDLDPPYTASWQNAVRSPHTPHARCPPRRPLRRARRRQVWG